jgi:hypothetical protein
VLARDDLAALLRRHPGVAHANIKLWLTDGAGLQALMNQTEHLRSETFKIELLSHRSTFVETSVLRKARQVLGEFGVCILAGPPGVGKTATASILLLQYMADGWRPVVAISEVRELEAQLLPSGKQVLFFDDFLGQTGLSMKLSKGEDSALVRLMHAVERDPDKIFILTTRDYILQQAKQDYEKLGDEVIELTKLGINIDEITASERAHILYNQLYYSPLRAQAAVALDGPRRYAELTHHPNYNPRLIEAAITAVARDLGLPRRRRPSASSSSGTEESPAGTTASVPQDRDTARLDLPDVLRRALDNPTELWDHVLRYQLNSRQRDLLITRISLEPPLVYLTCLHQAASAFAGTIGERPNTIDLDAALRVLEGDLLTIADTARGRKTTVGSLKPGVIDAVLDFLRRYPDYLQRLADSSVFFEQVQWLAKVLGVVRNSHSRRPSEPIARQLVLALTQSAERTLASPPAAAERWSGQLPGSGFDDFGRRLETLAAIYKAAGLQPSAGLSNQAFPPFVNAMAGVPHKELARVVAALRSEPLDVWRRQRTEIDNAVLRLLGVPDDLDSWSLLRDVLDIIKTTPEYYEDMLARFQEFAEEFAERAEDTLEDAKDDRDADLQDTLDELDQLESLANRWETDVSAIDEISWQIRDLEDQRSSQSIVVKHPPTSQPNRPERQSNGSIFDRL